MLSLAVATTAGATQPDSTVANKAKLLQSQSLIAQTYPRGVLNETRSRRFLDEMIVLHMKMADMAQEALQSQNPEIKKMAQETIKSSNAEINRMREMRRKIYEDGWYVLFFDVALDPGETWRTCINLIALVDGEMLEPKHTSTAIEVTAAGKVLTNFLDISTRLQSSN